MFSKFLNAFLKNWKTSTVGIILSFSGYVAMFPEGFNNNLVNVCRYINVGGLATLGLCSKDVNN